MKLLPWMALFVFLSTMNIAHAQLLLAVPFQNVTLIPNASLLANFVIGTHKIIFCYDNTLQTQGLITWPLGGIRQAGSLPIFLKTTNEFDGSFSDPAGFLTITNTTTTTLIVNCNFGF